jgi:hypothetical protein
MDCGTSAQYTYKSHLIQANKPHKGDGPIVDGSGDSPSDANEEP